MEVFGSDIELCCGSRPPRGVVIIFHGITSTPQETKNLAHAVHEAGFDLLVPLLAGHGVSVEELCRTRSEAWRSDAERAFSWAENKRKMGTGNIPLILIGVSFGSLLAFYLAIRHACYVSGVISLCPTVRLRTRSADFQSRVLSYLPEGFLDHLGTVPKGERRGGELLFDRIAFNEHSTGGIARVVKFRRAIWSQLSEVSCPVMLIQDPYDHHLSFSGLLQLSSALTDAPVELHSLVGGEHELLLGSRYEEVINLVVQFVRARIGE